MASEPTRLPNLAALSTPATVPQFYFPRTQHDAGAGLVARASHLLAVDDLKQMALHPHEMEELAAHLASLAVATPISSFQQRLLATYAPPATGMTLVDRFIHERRALSLSYDAFRSLARGEWPCSPSAAPKLRRLLPARCYLSLACPDADAVSALDLLAYLTETQLSIRVALHLGELAPPGAAAVSARAYAAFISSAIQRAVRSGAVAVPLDLADYYELICTRALVRPHELPGRRPPGELASLDQLAGCAVLRAFVRAMDADMRALFAADGVHGALAAGVYGSPRFFAPAEALRLHRQYLQLDADRSGLLSEAELLDFGKKRAFLPPGTPAREAAEPTHDLTRAFVAQVLARAPSSHGGLDFRAYVDFALAVMDRSSAAALRFFWDVLDVQQQGFLDAFTLDLFLRSLVDKLRSHRRGPDSDGNGGGNGDGNGVPTVEQLRAQLLDIIGPSDPARVTWTDLCRCNAGHAVVRILTDYVAYRAYERAGGRLSAA